jgi:FAD/FMN-containing dehydrogenase
VTRYVARNDLQSWGRILRAPHRVARPAWRDEIPALVAEGINDVGPLLAVGLRRSYGDSCLNAGGAVLDASGLDRAISLDLRTRVLRAEAGMSLDDLLRMIIHRGLFPPVTAGTRFITLGGAIANDIHGKNHHVTGTLGRWVRRLGLLRSDGQEVALEPDDPTGLFAATIGGLGLTGMILWVELELLPLESAMIECETIAFSHLNEFFQIAETSVDQFDYTVAWVDCLAKGASLGRGLFTRGSHATRGGLLACGGGPKLVVPFDLPSFALNGTSVRAFNTLYYWINKLRSGRATVHYQRFLYPLDAIGSWNRMYGSRGMYQYQSVVPPETARDATKAMLKAISTAVEGSFLAVLKTFGSKPSPGMLSFPMPGTTLALDFPNRGASTAALMARLDAIVREAGGRLYPAKDGRIPVEMFRMGYPNWETFSRHVDPGFSSSFWRRMSG